MADCACRKWCRASQGGKGNDKSERIIVVVRSACHENDPADARTGAQKSVLESANPAWTRSVHLDAPGQWHRQQPISAHLWDSQPRSSQTGQIIQGLC